MAAAFVEMEKILGIDGFYGLIGLVARRRSEASRLVSVQAVIEFAAVQSVCSRKRSEASDPVRAVTELSFL